VHRADDHPPLDPDTTARWMRYGRRDAGKDDVFPTLIGLQVEDVRQD
jgi:hypothetical protein